MNPIPLRTQRDFRSGLNSGFAVIAMSKEQFPVSTATIFRRGLLALALVGLTYFRIGVSCIHSVLEILK